MDPFLAEIRIFAGNFAPKGWARCDGQLMPLSSNTALFSLLGTMYGGDGKSTFGLPDLRGRAPIMFGQGPGLSIYDEGESSGAAAVTLLDSEMPAHRHTAMGNPNPGTAGNPEGAVWAASGGRGRPSTYVAQEGPPPVAPVGLSHRVRAGRGAADEEPRSPLPRRLDAASKRSERIRDRVHARGSRGGRSIGFGWGTTASST